jgi:hypothetical protein
VTQQNATKGLVVPDSSSALIHAMLAKGMFTSSRTVMSSMLGTA